MNTKIKKRYLNKKKSESAVKKKVTVCRFVISHTKMLNFTYELYITV